MPSIEIEEVDRITKMMAIVKSRDEIGSLAVHGNGGLLGGQSHSQIFIGKEKHESRNSCGRHLCWGSLLFFIIG
ncbi:hypothetical protein Dimus_005253 [Dionaea muscipula]